MKAKSRISNTYIFKGHVLLNKSMPSYTLKNFDSLFAIETNNRLGKKCNLPPSGLKFISNIKE